MSFAGKLLFKSEQVRTLYFCDNNVAEDEAQLSDPELVLLGSMERFHSLGHVR